MRKDHLRVRVCLTLILFSLFLSGPASVLGNWGREVGRAGEGDVVSLLSDWISFKRYHDAQIGRARDSQITAICRHGK